MVALLNLVPGSSVETAALENRALNPFPNFNLPALTSGEFAAGFDAWYADHFFYRDQLITLGSRVRELYGVSLSDSARIIRPGAASTAAGAAPPTPAGATPTAGAPAAAVPPAPAPAGGEDTPLTAASDKEELINEIIVMEDQAFEILTFNPASTARFAETVLNFTSSIEPAAPVYTAVIPSRLEFFPVAKYRNLGADQRTAIDFIYERLTPQVKTLDAWSILSDHRDEYIYFRTDHHWTALGAYYLYREFLRLTGQVHHPLENYTAGKVENFTGSLYLMTLKESLKKHPDTVIYYEPFTEHEYKTYWIEGGRERPVIDMRFAEDQNKYQIFISSDSPLAIIRSETAPDQKILVVKDSYGNAFIPFLIPHYHEIHIIDPRYFEQNLLQYHSDNQFNTVLFLVYFAVIGDAWSYSNNLDRIINLPY